MTRVALVLIAMTACKGGAAGPVDALAGDAPLADAAIGAVACTPTCNAQTGACGPLLACTAQNPCTTPNAPITTAITLPLCHTDAASGRPAFDDGAPMQWTGTSGDA